MKIQIQNNIRFPACIHFSLPWKALQGHIIAMATDGPLTVPALKAQRQPPVVPNLTTSPCISAVFFKEM